MSVNLDWIPAPWIYSVAGVLVLAVGYSMKVIFESIKRDWNAALEKLAVIETTTRVQAENHLMTIQTESVKQTKHLEDLVREQSQTNGYLKAIIDMGKR